MKIVGQGHRRGHGQGHEGGKDVLQKELDSLFASVSEARAFIGLDLMTDVEREIVADATKIIDGILNDAFIRLMHGDYRRLYG